MKNSQIILALLVSALVAVGTVSGFIQEHVHFVGVANEIAVFVLSGGFAIICAGILIGEAFKNVRNFFKK
jgi:hypothetical protein